MRLHQLAPAIFYGSYLLLAALITAIILSSGFVAVVLTIATLLYIYARWIEPKRLVVKHESTSAFPNRFALVSDLELGCYKGRAFLERIVRKLNEYELDFVLIPGDFVFSISPKNIASTFAPLKNLKAPIYAVLGNHDLEPAGQLKDKTLLTTLEGFGIHWIDNKIVALNGLQLVGLGELWNEETDVKTLEGRSPNMPTLVMVHNPDAAYLLPERSADSVLSGHAHGGQVRIPWLYKQFMRVKTLEHDFNSGRGWFTIHGNPLYITSGAGESLLPLRLGVPPEIVFFNLTDTLKS